MYRSIQYPRPSRLLPLLLPLVTFVPALLTFGVVAAHITAYLLLQGFFNQASAALILLGMLVYSALSLLAGVLVATTLGALLTVLLRGTAAVGWAWPSEVTSFDAWLYCSWNFFSNKGQQNGVRVLGLEIAFEGHL